MHPLFERLQNPLNHETNPNPSSPDHTPHSTPHPFSQLVDAFTSTDQTTGRGTTGPQESGTVTSFSAHMAPTFGSVKTRRGSK
jgi:hypothetical protein